MTAALREALRIAEAQPDTRFASGQLAAYNDAARIIIRLIGRKHGLAEALKLICARSDEVAQGMADA